MHLVTDADVHTLRPDLAAVEIDGEIVVYDPVEGAAHLLSGGAVAVWCALDGQPIAGLDERVANLVGLGPDDVAGEVARVVASFADLGLLSGTDPSAVVDTAPRDEP